MGSGVGEGVGSGVGLGVGSGVGDAVGAGLGIACMTTIFGLGIAVVASVSSYVFDWMVAEPVTEEAGP